MAGPCGSGTKEKHRMRTAKGGFSYRALLADYGGVGRSSAAAVPAVVYQSDASAAIEPRPAEAVAERVQTDMATPADGTSPCTGGGSAPAPSRPRQTTAAHCSTMATAACLRTSTTACPGAGRCGDTTNIPGKQVATFDTGTVAVLNLPCTGTSASSRPSRTRPPPSPIKPSTCSCWARCQTWGDRSSRSERLTRRRTAHGCLLHARPGAITDILNSIGQGGWARASRTRITTTRRGPRCRTLSALVSVSLASYGGGGEGRAGGGVRGEGAQSRRFLRPRQMPAPPSPPPTTGAIRDAPRHGSARHHNQLCRGDRGDPGRPARSDRRAKQWTDIPSGTHAAPPASGTDGGHRRSCSLSRLLSSQRVVGGDSDSAAAGDEQGRKKQTAQLPRPSSSIFSRSGGKRC